ncbi:MAG: hypothetical protein WBE93_18115, partial [Pseudolabrys sp.]
MLLQQSRTNLSYEGWAYRELDIADDVPDVALLAVTLRGRLTRQTVAFLDYCTELFAASRLRIDFRQFVGDVAWRAGAESSSG